MLIRDAVTRLNNLDKEKENDINDLIYKLGVYDNVEYVWFDGNLQILVYGLVICEIRNYNKETKTYEVKNGIGIVRDEPAHIIAQTIALALKRKNEE